jgi:hypothetical protein
MPEAGAGAGAGPRLCRTGNELELTLSSEAARLLGAALRRPQADLATRVDGSPAPYAAWLARILVRRRGTGAVAASIDEAASALVLEGGGWSLGLLATNVEGFSGDAVKPGDHLHIEYHDGHAYLAPGQVCIIVVADDGERAPAG